jgi:hypothetical protein
MLLLLQLVTKSWKLERIEGGLAMTDYKADFPGCSRGALKPSVAIVYLTQQKNVTPSL